jgi:cytochrome b6-f complex iron-sulfur subunit/menaquinol-cytochrome c reductase iron-sulfur subunit
MGTALFGAVLSIPLGGAVLAPLVRGRGPGKGKLVRVAPLSALVADEPLKVTIVGELRDSWAVTRRRCFGRAYLVLRTGGRVMALSATCPHLGCTIDLAPDRQSFECPCHGSAFRLDGKRVSGPSPRGMDELETRVERGEVFIRWTRYRQGTAAKVEVG